MLLFHFEPQMIEHRIRKCHKGASFEPHLTCTTLVFKPRRARRWCKTQRILALSSHCMNFERLGASKSLAKNDLASAPRAQSGVQYSPRRRSSVRRLIRPILSTALTLALLG